VVTAGPGGLPQDGQAPPVPRRPLPPVPAVAIAAMMLVIAGGIYVTAFLPRHAPLGPAAGLLAAAAGLLVADVAMLSRVRVFAWAVFFRVGGWTLAAYAVIAGMLEYVFVLDHTRGPLLAVLTLMLLVFAVDIPLLLAFSVARYQRAD
jgi:hypothetical protein